MRALPNPGNYPARRSGKIVIKEEKSGALMAYIPFILMGSDVNYSGKHGVVLAKTDGSLMLKNIEALRKVFEWDGANPWSLEEVEGLPAIGKPFSEENQGAEFELADCYHDNSFIPEGETEAIVQFKANWFNPIGGSTNMPVPVDEAKRKELLAKFGGKFKGASGGKPAAATPKPAAAAAKPAAQGELPATGTKAAAAPPTRRAAPAKTVRSMSQSEVWTKLTEANPDVDEGKLAEETFYPAADVVAPGKNGELTNEQWGQVADNLGL